MAPMTTALKSCMVTGQSSSGSRYANEMLHSFFVGNFDDPGAELNPIFGSSENVFQDAANLSSPFIDLERNIALFLGSFLSSGFQIGNGP